jgi:arylsulfatase A-like enzyme/predicted Zn-dependent protease
VQAAASPALTAAATAAPAPAAPTPTDLSLLLVTLDTTRADRIGAFARPGGGSPPATPRLDALAARGTIFTNAVAVTPLTLPAHTTIFTGLLPAAHGVRDNGGFRVAPERVTLAEVLAERGFSTGGFVSSFVLDRRWGIAQGFARYFDEFDVTKSDASSLEIERRGDETVRAALDWLESARGGRRFFAWVHLFDPHAPYAAPEPFGSKYASRPYDGEIAWTDALVGQLVDGLERLGLSGRTLVAVVGDHGESLGEHGETGHGFFIYQPSIHVPLLIAGPQGLLAEGRRVDAVVQQVDLAPTLLDLLGVPARLEPGPGRSLRPLLEAGADVAAPPGYSETFYPRLRYGWAELRSVRTPRWHFIEAPRPELFDLENDPGETRNLAEREPGTVAELRARLAEIDAATKPLAGGAAPVEEDQEALRKLSALGYLGGVAVDSGKSFRELPDPKDRVHLNARLARATALASGADPGAAERELAAIVAEDPGIVAAWYLWGNLRFEARDFDGAARHYRRVVKLQPTHDWAILGLADSLAGLGRVDDAVLGYRRYLAGHPDNAPVEYRFATLLLDSGRLDEAEAAFRRALALEPRSAPAEVGLSAVAQRRGDERAALAALDRALAIDATARFASFNRARIHETAGRLDEARAAYLAAIEADPGSFEAWFALGRLQSRLGVTGAALGAMRRAADARPELATGRIFVAEALLATGDVSGAEREASRGLALRPEPAVEQLGHFVLADVYLRMGNRVAAQREAALGQSLERRLKSAGGGPGS